jgi:hypothetical protein
MASFSSVSALTVMEAMPSSRFTGQSAVLASGLIRPVAGRFHRRPASASCPSAPGKRTGWPAR